MKPEHTPGPWKAVELDEFTVAIKTDRNYIHECIHIADAHVMTGNLGEEVPRAIANAKLIAAAPDLLKVADKAERQLMELVQYLTNEVDSFDGDEQRMVKENLEDAKEVLEQVKSAIKKATA